MIITQVPDSVDTLEHVVELDLESKSAKDTFVLKLGMVGKDLCYQLGTRKAWRKIGRVINRELFISNLHALKKLNEDGDIVNIHYVLPALAILTGEVITNYKM